VQGGGVGVDALRDLGTPGAHQLRAQETTVSGLSGDADADGGRPGVVPLVIVRDRGVTARGVAGGGGFVVAEAASGGTHPAPSIAPGAIATAERHALELPAESPRAVDTVQKESDLVVAVCDNAHEELHVPGRLHWSIADPVRVGTDAAFDTAYDELERRIAELAPRLVAS